jgi:hypothetical protein
MTAYRTLLRAYSKSLDEEISIVEDHFGRLSIGPPKDGPRQIEAVLLPLFAELAEKVRELESEVARLKEHNLYKA